MNKLKRLRDAIAPFVGDNVLADFDKIASEPEAPPIDGTDGHGRDPQVYIPADFGGEAARGDDGVAEIAAERAKQRMKWGDAHDDEHVHGEILDSAIDVLLRVRGEFAEDRWRLAEKHTDARDRLRIAGALIAAEMDRLARIAAHEAGGAQ